MNPRNRIGEIGDFVPGAPAEHRDRQLQRGTRIGCLPVVLLDPLDARVDRVRGEAEPLADLNTGGKCGTWTVWPRRDSSDSSALIGNRCPSAGEVYARIVAMLFTPVPAAQVIPLTIWRASSSRPRASSFSHSKRYCLADSA